MNLCICIQVNIFSEGWFVRQVSTADVGPDLQSDWGGHWAQDQCLGGQVEDVSREEQWDKVRESHHSSQ